MQIPIKESHLQYLKSEFEDVRAIVLHGSRAKGKAREHGDWDYFVFSGTDQEQRQFRVIVDGDNIEFVVYTLPLSEESVAKKFGPHLQGAVAVYDLNNVTQDIFVHAARAAESFTFSFELRASRMAFLESKLNGMIDYANEPMHYIKYHSMFYLRSINTWFNVRNLYSQSLNDALPHIRKHDPTFYEHLQTLADIELPTTAHIPAAKKIFAALQDHKE